MLDLNPTRDVPRAHSPVRRDRSPELMDYINPEKFLSQPAPLDLYLVGSTVPAIAFKLDKLVKN